MIFLNQQLFWLSTRKAGRYYFPFPFSLHCSYFIWPWSSCLSSYPFNFSSLSMFFGLLRGVLSFFLATFHINYHMICVREDLSAFFSPTSLFIFMVSCVCEFPALLFLIFLAFLSPGFILFWRVVVVFGFSHDSLPQSHK